MGHDHGGGGGEHGEHGDHAHGDEESGPSKKEHGDHGGEHGHDHGHGGGGHGDHGMKAKLARLSGLDARNNQDDSKLLVEYDEGGLGDDGDLNDNLLNPWKGKNADEKIFKSIMNK